jgi:hypothetical protein
MNQSPLKPLHSDEALSPAKLDKFRKLSDEELIESLQPGQDGSLKARPDGTVLEGNHRLKILRERRFDVDALPREIIAKDSPTTYRRQR